MYTVKDVRFETEDDYEREGIAKKILGMVDNSNNSPLFIDGAWGAGKSEFCYKLFHFLKDSNEDESLNIDSKLIVSYINSFAGDYQSNPFMLIVQAIYNSLIPKDADASEIRHVQDKIAKCAKFVKSVLIGGLHGTSIKISPPLAGVELGVKGEDVIKGVRHERDLSEKDFKTAFIEELEEFRSAAKKLREFKNAIEDAIDGRKLILIIDELDRCRPDYALELLENIKHIFDIKNLFIIFSANKEQLEAMICKKYGYGTEAEGYLEKFYKKTIFLSSKITEKTSQEGNAFVGHLTVFCKKLEKHTRSRARGWKELDFRALPFVKELLGTVETRQVERIAEELNIYCSITGEVLDEMTDTRLSLIIFGMFLLVTSPTRLREIKKTSIQEELLKFLKELPVAPEAILMVTSYVKSDLEGVSASREDILFGDAVPSIIKRVGDTML